MSAAPLDGSGLLGFSASLIVVIGTIVALGWLYSRSKAFAAGKSDVITIIASRAIGSKERLVVVEVGGQQLLIGMTASQVRTLHVFDSPLPGAIPAAEIPGFASRLRSALREMRH